MERRSMERCSMERRFMERCVMERRPIGGSSIEMSYGERFRTISFLYLWAVSFAPSFLYTFAPSFLYDILASSPSSMVK